MDDTLDPNALGFLISDSARLMRSLFEKRIADAGIDLTPGEARTLIYVAAVNGSRQQDIAQRMNIEPMTVCTFLDKLQALDLIQRQPDPSDRRAKKVVLTAKSDAMLDAVAKELNLVLTQATDGMSTETRAALHDALILFRNNLQQTDRFADNV